MTDPRDTLGFVRNRLDRHSAEQPEEAVPAFDAPDARLVLICGDRIVLRGPTALITPADASELSGTRIFLGHRDGRPVFAASAPAEAAEGFAAGETRTLDLRSIATESAVEAEELGLLAVAKSMLDWHARHGFCANCGTATVAKAGEGCNSRFSNNRANSGVATRRSRANSATTLIASTTKNG